MARKKKDEESPLVRDTNFNPSDLIDKAAKDLDPAALDDFSDEDLPRAKNVYQFCTSSKFLYAGTYPFAMQMKVMLDLFEDYCPKCSNLDFWKKIKVDTPLAEFPNNLVFYKHGKCKKCGENRGDAVKAGYFQYKNELACCVGMRGGKTAMVGMIAGYQLHRFLTLKQPAQTFGLRPGSTLHMTFSALTAGQAEETLWDSLVQTIDYAPWFIEYHKLLDAEGKKKGIQLYNYQNTKLDYFHKNLYVGFMGAEFKKMKGRTRFFTAIDEMGFFDSENKGAVKANASEVFAALEKSLRTLRSEAFNKRAHGAYDIPTGMMVNVSSVSDINDAMMKRVREAERNKKICAYHLATWEFNPGVSRASALEEAKNPLTFDRDYGSIPPLAADPFINDKEMLDQIFYHKYPPLFQTNRQEKLIEVYGLKKTYFWDELVAPFDEMTIPRCVTVDTGESNNSFAVGVFHLDNVEDRIICDQLIEMRPEDNKLVYFPGVLDDFILRMLEHYWVLYYVFDQWNSISLAQSVITKGVRADTYPLTYDDMDEVRKILATNQIIFPYTENLLTKTKTSEIHEVFQKDPISHCKLQLATIRDLGRKVVKPTNGTDDLWRVTALAVTYINQHREEFADYQAGVMPMYRNPGKKGSGLAFSMATTSGRMASSAGRRVGGMSSATKPIAVSRSSGGGGGSRGFGGGSGGIAVGRSGMGSRR